MYHLFLTYNTLFSYVLYRLDKFDIVVFVYFINRLSVICIIMTNLNITVLVFYSLGFGVKQRLLVVNLSHVRALLLLSVFLL